MVFARSRLTAWSRLLCIAVIISVSMGCATWRGMDPPPVPAEEHWLTVTAYCDCRQCTGWILNRMLRPVHAYGPHMGKPKIVGQAADGSMARKGTVAADTAYFPFGTIMYIPGYGYGQVRDRGTAIQGDRIDVFFHSHRQALEWGRQRLLVQVWPPPPSA